MARRRSQAAAVVALLVVVLLGAACDWSQFRYGPDHTGFSTFETTIGPANISGLRLRWSQRAGNYGFGSPTIANGVVYAQSDKLYAVDANTGSAHWSSEGIGYPLSAPAVANGVVYISGDKFYALSAMTGAQLWSVALASGTSAPTVVNGVVYVSREERLYALHAMTGAQLWSSTAHGSSPTVANGVVYVHGDHGLYALNAATGARIWRVAAATGTSPPAVMNGVVYVGGDIGFFALNAATGERLWSSTLEGNAAPAVANGVVYLSSDKLYALNATTGAQLWSAWSDSFPGSPTVANGVVYVGAEKLFAYNTATGARLWSATTTGDPVIANGVVYVGGAELHAYSLPIPTPQLSISPAFDYDFVFGEPGYETRTYTITNNGSSPTSALANGLSGPDAAHFRLVLDGCAGITLAGGASCTATTAFAPTRSGRFTAWLTSTATAGGIAKAVLQGTAQPLTLSPSQRAFGDVFAGSTATSVVTVTNLSAGPVGPIATAIAPGRGFTIGADRCAGTTIAAGTSCTIGVRFAPTSDQDYFAMLVTEAPGHHAEASLSGRGLARLEIAPRLTNFGSVAVGTDVRATLTVTNISPVTTGPITDAINYVWGSNWLRVTSDRCAGQTLAAKASCTIAVTIAPISSGSFWGEFTATAPLAGRATAFMFGGGS